MSSEISKKDLIKNDSKKQKGASLVEYGLLVALIAVVCIVAITSLGSSVSSKFTSVSTAM